MNIQNLVKKSMALLKDELRLNATEDGLKKCFDVWQNQKADLLELFRNHPNWNEDKLRIEIDAELVRGINRNDTRKFYNWANKNISRKVVEDNKLKIGMVSVADAFKIRNSLWADLSNYRGCLYVSKETTDRIEAEYKRYKELCEKFSAPENYHKDWTSGEYITNEKYYTIDSAQRVISYITDRCNQFFNEENVEEIKRRISEDVTDFPEPSKGMKTSKYIGKVCKFVGIDTIVDMQTRTWTTDDGEQHEREVDEGYNKRFAEFADAINPNNKKEKLYISLNPIDFWTASFGNGWGSCYHIDVHNTRRSVSNRYSGSYCAGTSGYMMDKPSFVVYIEGDCDEWGSYTKKYRCMFAYGEEKLFQSKVYPNSRDGYQEQFRAIIQDLIAELEGRESKWLLKRSSLYKYYRWGEENSHALGYDDYYHQNESNVSLLKDNNENINDNKIVIGSHPISITNGKPLSSNGSIESYIATECEHCGREIDLDNDDFVLIGDEYYCDAECAEADGYRYTYDTERWKFEDDVIETEDGYYFEYTSELYYSSWNEEYYKDKPDSWVWCEIDGDYAYASQITRDNHLDEDFIVDEHDDMVSVMNINGEVLHFINSDNAEQYQLAHELSYNEEENKFEEVAA